MPFNGNSLLKQARSKLSESPYFNNRLHIECLFTLLLFLLFIFPIF